ncbi:ARHGEF2 [Mytilus coruscus]|uniref:ARHGEF2 n=1 Tax=Mytilus coruscus TaxID=42192 RepID=A0A6J7ZTS9_MYTCO|nr:ARHGEF2 [Mytilus coruscus]
MAVPYAITAAEILLREETIDDEKCLVCNDEMTDDKQACPTCNHISHNKCFNITSDQCYSCHAIEEQRTLSENQTPVENNRKIDEGIDHQTDVSHVDTTTIMASENNSCTGLHQTIQTASEQVNNTSQTVISEKESMSTTPMLTSKQEQQTKQKELKQQEL